MKFIDLVNKLAKEGGALPQVLLVDGKNYKLSELGKYYYLQGADESIVENRIAPDTHPSLEIESWA